MDTRENAGRSDPHPTGASVEAGSGDGKDRRSGIARIAGERAKQLNRWSAAHDDGHHAGELVEAAQQLLTAVQDGHERTPAGAADWGLVERHQDPIDRLTIAGALVAAEIDRRLREATVPDTAPKPDAAPSVTVPETNRALEIELWGAVNNYAEACGGDTSARTVSNRRQTAVVKVDRAVRSIVEAQEAQASRSARGDRVHTLKCWPQYFDAILAGDKRCELRRDDRGGFEPDDVLRLMEWDPEPTDDLTAPRGYTGRQLFVLVTHVSRGKNHQEDYQPNELERALDGMALLSFQLIADSNSWFEQEVGDG